MTALLDTATLDRITAEAHEVRPVPALLNIAALLLIWFGRLLGYAWLIPVWCFLAIRVGWRDVHPPKVSDGRAGPR